MLIGGFQKISLIDYPGKISSIIFTQGCNFRCPFCHNASLVDPIKFEQPISEDKIFNFLTSRAKQIDGVVISGGEPTLHNDLIYFAEKIKAMGFSIKLDTNGTKPDIIAKLVNAKLIDFIAMDIKNDWDRYSDACGTNSNINGIKRSVHFIMNCGIDYEFRTTVVPSIHSANDIIAIAKNIDGAKKFVIQEFVPDHAMNENLRKEKSSSILGDQNVLEDIKFKCLKYVQIFEIRKAN